MKKSTNFSAEKGRRLKIFATIFAAIFALIALATGLALKNYGGRRRTDLAQITAAATAPTDTSKYWTDEAAWSAAGKDFNNYTLSGSGGPDDPYLIQSEWDLAYLSWTIYTDNPIGTGQVIISGSYKYFYSGIYFEQTADLDLSAYYWQPIGIYYLRDGTSERRYFSGYYDGGSHTVAGVFTLAGEGDGYSYQGLFGYVYGRSSTNLATISNVGVIDSFVQGYEYVGGVVGRASRSTVTNCYNTGSVEGSDYYAGGVVGDAWSSSTVTNCYNTGLVSGSTYVGGVVGQASTGHLTNCYNTGSVSGSGIQVGGVVGRYDYAGRIENCYNTGSVEGYSDVGGVVGWAYAIVENCYNTGSVEGDSEVGGVVGLAFSGSTVTNCYNTGSVSGSVSGSGSDVGGVVGESSNGTVTNCYNTGSVSGSSRVGGVVANVSGSRTVTNCYNTGSVSGSSDKVGGVVGSTASAVTNCYNTGSVEGDSDVGGVVGGTYFSSSSSRTIINCYNTGSVSGSSYVGGVVGQAYSSSSSDSCTIMNCYNTGSVSGSNYVGGVVGYAWSSSTISNTYYGGDCTLDVGIGEGPGSAVKIDKPVEEWAKNQDWYSADAVNADGSPVWSDDSLWNFETVWEFVENAPDCATNNGYPVLQGVFSSQVIYWTDVAVWSAAGKDFNNYTLSGSGSQEDPYLIQNEWDLAYLSWTIATENPSAEVEIVEEGYACYYPGLYFEQTADLDLSAYYWQPIATFYPTNITPENVASGNIHMLIFSGNYDGNGYSISGLYTPEQPDTPDDTENYESFKSIVRGLFGVVMNMTETIKIENITISSGKLQGSSRIGAVAGMVDNAIVQNCSNYATVEVNYNIPYPGWSPSGGGIVGYASGNFAVTNCHNYGEVVGINSGVGGVVGEASQGIVSGCSNFGLVESDGHAAGIIYSTDYKVNIEIIDNSNFGTVVGATAAGIVARLAEYEVNVKSCFNAGDIYGTEEAGGIVGIKRNGGGAKMSTIEDCGNEGKVYSENYVGAIIGGYASNGPVTISNCYAILQNGLDTLSGTDVSVIENCVYITMSDDGTGNIVVQKKYIGSDFSGFAWLNFDSSPVPKGLSWAGQFQEPPAEYAGNSNWILTKMQSEGWSAI